MIFALSGKPGGGKTLYSVKLIIEELVYGTRPVVTNVALKLGELSDYIHQHYPDKNVNVLQRVRLIDEDELKEFYRYRGFYVDGVTGETKEAVAKPGDKVTGRVDFQFNRAQSEEDKQKYLLISEALKDKSWASVDATLGGVFYVLDEVHLAFNNRTWQETGRSVIFYMSQHRKLGDDVVWITQAVQNVDKQFRSFTQEYVYLRNLAKEMVNKWVRHKEAFRREHYLEPYTGSQTCIGRFEVKFDKDMARCYDTSAGVGIVGGRGAEPPKKRGLPFWCLPVGLAAMLLIGWYVCIKGPKLLVSQILHYPMSTGQTAQSASLLSKTDVKFHPPFTLTDKDKPPFDKDAHDPHPTGQMDKDGHLIKDKSNYQLVMFPLKAASASNFVKLASKFYPDYTFDAINGALAVGRMDPKDIPYIRILDVPFDVVAFRLHILSVDDTKDKGWSVSALISSLNGIQGVSFSLANGVISAGTANLTTFTDAIHRDFQAIHIVSTLDLAGEAEQELKFTSGTQIPVTTQVVTSQGVQQQVTYKDVLFSLSLFPSVKDDECWTKVDQRFDSQATGGQASAGVPPTISTQTLSVFSELHKGDTLVLASLSKDTQQMIKGFFTREVLAETEKIIICLEYLGTRAPVSDTAPILPAHRP